MPAPSLWLLAFWRLRACQGLAPAATSDSRPQGPAAGFLRAEGPAAPLLPASPPGGDAPQPSAFDLSIDGGAWSLRAPRWHHGGGAQSLAAPPRVEGLKNLRWLHIPKTGTSLIATIWNYACGQKGAPLDLYVDDYHGPLCQHCYDFALMDRYPRERYCEPGVLSVPFDTQHRAAQQREFSSESVVGFFRRPSQRIISAHRNSLHASGLGDENYRELIATCGFQNVSCFARWRGIAGCSAKMLAGHNCADPEPSQPWDGGQRHVKTAVANIEKMRFVGITEEWDESVCLFHRMFGGRISPAEFKNFHTSMPGRSEDYDETDLHGFVDEADELVYAAAARRFAALKAEYAGGTSACRDDLEVSHTYAQGGEEELSCAARKWECGLHGEGAAGETAQLDCGRCPPKRVENVPGMATQAGLVAVCLAGGTCNVTGLDVPPNTFSWYHSS